MPLISNLQVFDPTKNMDNEIFLFFLLIVVTVLTPGPGVLYTISCGFRYGRRHLFLSPAAISIGVVITNIAAAAGLGVIVATSQTLYTGIQIAGGLVLFYLGYRNWTAPEVDFSSATYHAQARAKDDAKTAFITGVLISITNPVLIVSLVSLFPQFIHPEDDYVQKASLLIAIYGVVCFAGHVLYSSLTVLASQYLKGTGVSRILNKGSAILFWIIAAGILVKIFQTFF